MIFLTTCMKFMLIKYKETPFSFIIMATNWEGRKNLQNQSWWTRWSSSHSVPAGIPSHLGDDHSRCRWVYLYWVKEEYVWPCTTKPTTTCTAYVYAMVQNRWCGSVWVILRYWYLLKGHYFFYIIWKFGSIKHNLSTSVLQHFFGPMFVTFFACALLFLYNPGYLSYFKT